MGHQCDYKRLRYCLAVANKNRGVHVCDRTRTLGDEPMAFRLPHGLQDALRYAARGANALDEAVRRVTVDEDARLQVAGDEVRIAWFEEGGRPPQKAVGLEVLRLSSLLGRDLRAVVDQV